MLIGWTREKQCTMGAKQSKGGKVTDQNGTDANNEEGLDTFNKTSTLPATFRSKDDDVTRGGTLPRDGAANIDRNTSFSKRFRKSVSRLIGVSEKDEKQNGTSPQKESSPETANGEASPTKEADERDSSIKSPVDHKLAQKIARAKFFQDLYTTPTNIPKPPRSLNVSVDTADGEDKSATPVVKLIERHQEAIEKHQEEIRNSMSSPDIMKDRLESFRKSKVIENGSMLKKEETNETKTESSFTNRIENQEELITTQQSSSEQKTFETTSVACQESSSMKVESSQITETKSQHIAENLETRESITSSSVEQAATHIEATETKMSVSESVVESTSESQCVQSTTESVMESLSSASTMESVSVAQSTVSQSIETSNQQITSESIIESSSSCIENRSAVESVTTTMESMSLQAESQTKETVSQSTFESMESHSSTEESHVITEQKSSEQIETCQSQVSESLVQTSIVETESSSANLLEDQTVECESSNNQSETDEVGVKDDVESKEGSDVEKPEAKDSANESEPE